MLPGSEEKWQVKINGPKGEQLATELLASMYDASLDAIKPHQWTLPNIWPTNQFNGQWNAIGFSSLQASVLNNKLPKIIDIEEKLYDEIGIGNPEQRDEYTERLWWMSADDIMYEKGLKLSEAAPEEIADSMSLSSRKAALDEVVVVGNGTKKKAETKSEENSGANDQLKIRKNFNETAFFYPDLKTDAEGSVTFSFTMPESLTKWKMMLWAHTPELASAYSEKLSVTQKELMVQPNLPRFLREGDKIEIPAKIINLNTQELTGMATLELFDAQTGISVDGWFKNIFPTQYFTVSAEQSTALKFPIEIPFNFNAALGFRIVAKAANYSDGEENILPVLTNRMLVTEALPINMKGAGTQNFEFKKLINSASNTTLTHHALTIEYSANPIWYAVQALPYLMEYPYECAEQTFNRYYANTLAESITKSTPKIKAVFENWKSKDTANLISNLQKNEALKSILLEETPWVMDAKNETAQKKNIALLFDLNKLGKEGTKSLQKLKSLQTENGGWAWFKGGPDDRYITQYILTGIGHLVKLNALEENEQLDEIIDNALAYLDAKLDAEWNDLKKSKAKLTQNNLSTSAIQYLYMRSFFLDEPVANSAKPAVQYYL
jgi:hypothetical protein